MFAFCRRLWFFLFGFVWLCLAVPAWGGGENPRETPIVKVVRANAPAVVNISTERIVLLRETPFWGDYGNEFDFLFEQFFGSVRPRRALKFKSIGSGVVVDKNGIIVTNAHVVHMASSIYVILQDGTSVNGRVVYENPDQDLALIKVDSPQPLKAVALGSTGDIMIGETVVAIGNPLGFENSVTVGVISGKDRSLYSSRGIPVAEELLQTDAPINPGNSGGALLNLNGELIGINVAVVQNSQSIGFAIPVEKVKESLEGYARNQSFPIKFQKKTRALQQQAQPSLTPPSSAQERWDPFAEMERMREQMDQMFQGLFSRQNRPGGRGMFNTDLFYDPNFDMEEKDDAYVIRFDIAGTDKEKINIEISEYTLTISGERSVQTQERHPSGFSHSSSFGSFLRTIPLPEDADTAAVTTKMEKDTLIITLPKK